MNRLCRSFALLTALSSLLLWLPSAPATAEPVGTSATTTDPSLAARVGALLRDKRASQAEVGLMIADAGTGSALVSRKPDQQLTPASNLKLVTAAAALDLLGADRRFSTSVYAAAAPTEGVVQGDLYLKGGGDPTLQESDLRSLAAQLKEAGVLRVTGAVVGDGSYFDNDRYHDRWDPADFSFSYAPQVAGLTLAPSADWKVGTILITYRPGSARGKPARLGVIPASAAGYVKLINRTTTTRTGTGASIRVTRRSGTNTVVVSGRVASGRATARRLVTISNPARYAAHTFRRVLAAAGITVERTATTGTTPAARVRLARDRSVTLPTILTRFLKLSNNGVGEHLVKTLGRRNGRPGTWAAGAARLTSWLARARVAASTVRVVDGSGLAHRNKLTARGLVRVLLHVRTRPWFPAFLDALPVAGMPDPMVGGTLATRMRGTAAAGNLRAKTGTLSGVTGLSGYVTGADGRLYVFSMLGRYRSLSPRPVFDAIGVQLARWRAS